MKKTNNYDNFRIFDTMARYIVLASINGLRKTNDTERVYEIEKWNAFKPFSEHNSELGKDLHQEAILYLFESAETNVQVMPFLVSFEELFTDTTLSKTDQCEAIRELIKDFTEFNTLIINGIRHLYRFIYSQKSPKERGLSARSISAMIQRAMDSIEFESDSVNRVFAVDFLRKVWKELELTNQQKLVLKMRAKGLSNGEIAKKLHRDKGTVSEHYNKVVSRARALYPNYRDLID